MTIAKPLRCNIAASISGWIQNPAFNNSVLKNFGSLAESLPIYAINLEAPDSIPFDRWVRDTRQHLHLLRGARGPRGYARTREKEPDRHRLHALSLKSPIPAKVGHGLEKLAERGLDELSIVRLISVRALGVMALWAQDQQHDLVCVLVAPPQDDGMQPMQTMTPSQFRALIQQRLYTAVVQAEKPSTLRRPES